MKQVVGGIDAMLDEKCKDKDALARPQLVFAQISGKHGSNACCNEFMYLKEAGISELC